MPTSRSLLGHRAEELAAAKLARSGYEILEKNYRCRYGEIDIIAHDVDDLVFVEVRSRRSLEPFSPAESVDARKQEKLILTAQHYLMSHDSPADTDCRFDVVEVHFERGKTAVIDIIKGAFREE